jgi:hypothetical protein
MDPAGRTGRLLFRPLPSLSILCCYDLFDHPRCVLWSVQTNRDQHFMTGGKIREMLVDDLVQTTLLL